MVRTQPPLPLKSLSKENRTEPKRNVSTMEEKSQLAYRGIDPFCCSSPSHRQNLLPLHRRSSRVFAVAADPNPVPITTVNTSSSRSPPSKAINGVSQVTLLEDTMLKKLNSDLKKLPEDQGLDETLLGNILELAASIAPEGIGRGKNV